jgi:hypothetical protein
MIKPSLNIITRLRKRNFGKQLYIRYLVIAESKAEGNRLSIYRGDGDGESAGYI